MTITQPIQKPHLSFHNIGTDYKFERKIVWFNAIGFLLLHCAALIGLFLMPKATLFTHIWTFLILIVPGFGVTVGAHRFYSHKAFKAHISIRFVLILLHTIMGQNCLYIWVRDHRQHHKYTDTDADPHNANRGFFFSHVGWLMSRKHPQVIIKGKTIDLSDLEADPLVMFQKRHYNVLYAIFALGLPICVPVYFWGEDIAVSFFYTYFTRYIIALNITWSINSVAHIFGNKPYDRNISPGENPIMSNIALGEGYHNYHHAFPNDYRAGEYGLRYSPSTAIIDFLAEFGLIYDLKFASIDLIKRRTLQRGDGTHPKY